MDSNAIIFSIRKQLNRDLSEDEESMIYNAFQYGKEEGFLKFSYDIGKYIEDKRINKRSVKLKEFNHQNTPIKHYTCEYCERDLPETECRYKWIGDEYICICERCLQNKIDTKLIEIYDECDNEVRYYFTTEGKHFRIQKFQGEIDYLTGEINRLQKQIDHNCKNYEEYYEKYCMDDYNDYGDDDD